MWIIPTQLKYSNNVGMSSDLPRILFRDKPLKVPKNKTSLRHMLASEINQRAIPTSESRSFSQAYTSTLVSFLPNTNAKARTCISYIKYLKLNTTTWGSCVSRNSRLVIQEPLYSSDESEIVIESSSSQTTLKYVNSSKGNPYIMDALNTQFSFIHKEAPIPKHVRTPLNPRWVESLMGIPIGWVNPHAKSIMKVSTVSKPLTENKNTHNWMTPRASQRGDNLGFYLKRSITQNHPSLEKRKVFTPMLQVQVEAHLKGLDISKTLKNAIVSDVKLKDIPEFVQNIISYRK